MTQSDNCPSATTRRHQQGNSLIEVLLVIVLLGMLSIPLLLSINRINRNFAKLTILANATTISQRNLEIANHIVQTDWQTLSDLQFYQPYHLVPDGADWRFEAGEQTQGVYTTQLTLEPVCRNSELELVPCSASTSQDPNSRLLISTTTWLFDGQQHQSRQQLILTNLFAQQP